MNALDIVLEILRSLSLILPIFVAGVLLIIALKKDYLAALNIPIDQGIEVAGKRILGDNKTWRGVAIYVVVSVIVCYVLQAVIQIHPLVIHPIFAQSPFIIGLAFSLSYIFGELVNSVIKRRLGIASGKESGSTIQKVADNVDGMLVISCVLIIMFHVSMVNILIAVAAGIVLHSVTDFIMRRNHLK